MSSHPIPPSKIEGNQKIADDNSWKDEIEDALDYIEDAKPQNRVKNL